MQFTKRHKIRRPLSRTAGLRLTERLLYGADKTEHVHTMPTAVAAAAAAAAVAAEAAAVAAENINATVDGPNVMANVKSLDQSSYFSLSPA